MVKLIDSPVYNSIFSEFSPFNGYYERLAGGLPSSNRTSSSLNVHPVKRDDNGDTYEIEVPGIEPSDVKVRIEGRTLSVETPKGGAYVSIGQRSDVDGTTANLKHGLLTVTVPKREAKVVEVSVSEI